MAVFYFTKLDGEKNATNFTRRNRNIFIFIFSLTKKKKSNHFLKMFFYRTNKICDFGTVHHVSQQFFLKKNCMSRRMTSYRLPTNMTGTCRKCILTYSIGTVPTYPHPNVDSFFSLLHPSAFSP